MFVRDRGFNRCSLKSNTFSGGSTGGGGGGGYPAPREIIDNLKTVWVEKNQWVQNRNQE